jgi:hypothetical protein
MCQRIIWSVSRTRRKRRPMVEVQDKWIIWTPLVLETTRCGGCRLLGVTSQAWDAIECAPDHTTVMEYNRTLA